MLINCTFNTFVVNNVWNLLFSDWLSFVSYRLSTHRIYFVNIWHDKKNGKLKLSMYSKVIVAGNLINQVQFRVMLVHHLNHWNSLLLLECGCTTKVKWKNHFRAENCTNSQEKKAENWVIIDFLLSSSYLFWSVMCWVMWMVWRNEKLKT